MLFGGYLISATSPSIAGWWRDSGATYGAIFVSIAIMSAVLIVLAAYLRPRSES
jgi:cyanate permease